MKDAKTPIVSEDLPVGATHAAVSIVSSVVALVAVTIMALSHGTVSLSFDQIVHDAEARLIFFDLRVPRVLFAILVGCGLAVVGAAYQSLLRNPLASPFTLGVSSGAALGASLSLMFQGSGLDVAASAVVGSLISIFIILMISRRIGAAAGDSLLLVGIIFSFFCSSILTMLQYISDYSQLFRVTRWMMGGIPAVQMYDIGIGALCVTALVVWIVRNHRSFDLMLFGDDLATVKGADVTRLYYTTFILSSLVVGWIVAQCGVIGFVGIVVPAIARTLVGSRHKYVIPLSAIMGAFLVVSCDLLGRVVRPPFEVPAGVFTAIIGGPIFIALAITGFKRMR